MLSREDIVKKVAEVPFWGQSIPLPYGVVTPGRVMKNLDTLKHLQLPENLNGKRVLDVGAWDGFYAFEAEKRGAEVIAIDNCERMKRPGEKQFQHLGSKSFETAKAILESKVQYKNLDVYEVSPESVGMVDITLFLGVLYHLKHPMLAIEKLAAVTREMMIVESAWFGSLTKLPSVRYTGVGLMNDDPTTWFVYNTPAIVGMIRDAGFPRVDVLWKTPLTPIQWLKSLYYNKPVWGRAWWNSNLLSCGRIVLRCFKK